MNFPNPTSRLRRPSPEPMDASRPRRSPGTERFLGLFSSPSPFPSPSAPHSAADELHEGDLLFSAPSSDSPPDSSKNPARVPQGYLGLLAALHDGENKLLLRSGGAVASAASAASAGTQLRRKVTIAAAAAVAACPASAARGIPAAQRPKNPEPPAAPCHQSAPVQVPVWPPRRLATRGWGELGSGGDEDEDEEELFRGDAAMLPPHEMVARASGGGSGGGALIAPSSMLEGAGRTLKGRDLRRVRDAVLRQTGFLD